MNNITNLPSCKEYNRILKNESGLCPKCLAKTIDTEVSEIVELQEVLLELQPTPDDVEEIKMPLKPGQAIRQRFQ